MVNNTDSSLAYAGQWSHSRTRGFGDYQDDVHFARNDGDSVTVTWTGTGVDVLTETYSDEGPIEVYLDGQSEGTVNAYSSTRKAQQVVYTTDNLRYGVHTLRLVKKGGKYLLVDRFNYR